MSAAIDETDQQAETTVPLGYGYLRLASLTAPNGVIDVTTYYSPALTSTLINEHDILGITAAEKSQFSGLTMEQDFHGNYSTGTVAIICRHKLSTAKDRLVTGVIIGGKCYSNPIIVPAQDVSSPQATALNSLEFAKQHDPSFAKACLSKTVSKIKSVLKSKTERFS